MQNAPTLEVDEDTYQLFVNYMNRWIAFLDAELASYNISPSPEQTPEWYRNLDFSNQQRKAAFRLLQAGMTVRPLPFTESEDKQ